MIQVPGPIDDRQIVALFRAGLDTYAIGKQIRRPEWQVYKRLWRARELVPRNPPPQSITASVCGDPRPGRSALDRKRLGLEDVQ